MFVTWFSLAGAAFPYQPLAVFLHFFFFWPLFLNLALKPAAAPLSPLFLKACGWLSEEPLVFGFNPRGFNPQGAQLVLISSQAPRGRVSTEARAHCLTLVRSGEVHCLLLYNSPPDVYCALVQPSTFMAKTSFGFISRSHLVKSP